MDPHHQFLAGKRLDNIVIHADIETMDLVILFAKGTEHDKRHTGMRLLDFLDCRKAIQIRHHDIHDTQIIVVLFTLLHRLQAVFCLIRLETFIFCVFPDHVPDLFFIVNNQYSGHKPLSLALFLMLLYRLNVTAV